MPEIDLELIKSRRLKNKYTLNYMRMKLGLKSPSDYIRREKGEYKFKATEIPVLAKVLGIPIEKIFKL